MVDRWPHTRGRPIQESVQPGRRPAVAVTAVVSVVMLLLGAGVAVLARSSKTERVAKRDAQRTEVTYVERQAGRPGATIQVGQWWKDCGLYELRLDKVRTTVAVVQMDGVWKVARESGRPAYTFHTDSSYTREDCLDIAS
jgi:hypothetical protein